jgi:hypothetical protein
VCAFVRCFVRCFEFLQRDARLRLLRHVQPGGLVYTAAANALDCDIFMRVL